MSWSTPVFIFMKRKLLFLPINDFSGYLRKSWRDLFLDVIGLPVHQIVLLCERRNAPLTHVT
jgi:hypothetical protein